MNESSLQQTKDIEVCNLHSFWKLWCFNGRFAIFSSKTLTDASKEVGLEVNVEKTKCMLVSRDQNAGQNWEIRTANRSFENVS
jgi:hypothetical protein